MNPPFAVFRPRRPLARSLAAIRRGSLTVGFLGGSITAPKTGTRWPEPLVAWLLQRFPGVRLTIENAALGATGSDLGACRVGPDIVARGCDLVFVEYAVNDLSTPTPRRQRTREGILRQLVAAGADVVLVHTFCAEMLPDLEAGTVPATVAEFEALADHYGLASVWVGLQAWTEVGRGLMTWEEWLPDGLHPEERGSLSYAQTVIAFLEQQLTGGEEGANRSGRPTLPDPVHPGCWERVERLDLAVAERAGPWSLRRWFGCLGMDQALRATVPGASLRIPFDGRGLVLGFDFGRLAGEVRYRVDQGEWYQTQRDRPAWCGDSGWLRPLVVAEDLAPGRHLGEIETLAVALPEGRGTHTTIGLLAALH